MAAITASHKMMGRAADAEALHKIKRGKEQ